MARDMIINKRYRMILEAKLLDFFFRTSLGMVFYNRRRNTQLTAQHEPLTQFLHYRDK